MIRMQMTRVQMTRIQTLLQALAGAAALLALPATMGLSQRSLAQTPARTRTLSSAPLFAGSGEKLLLCAANNLFASISPASVSATNPAASTTVTPATFAPSTNLFVARIELNPQPLPPGVCRVNALTASLQAFTIDTAGNPTNTRIIAFTPPDPCIRPFFRRGPPPTAANR